MPWVAVAFRGTPDQALELAAAIRHNCDCSRWRRCGAHSALMEQRFIDGLLWGRWMAPRLRAEEWRPR